MHRLFLGCNLWSAVFFLAAALTGWGRSPWHPRVALFAAVFGCLVQCGIVALFLGAAKLAKEHVGRFDMPLSLIDRVNAVYHRLVPMAAIGAVLVAATALVGGLADLGRVPMAAHHLLALGTLSYLTFAIPRQYRLQETMHRILMDIETLLPDEDKIPKASPHPGYRPDQVVLDRAGRARALLYVGLSLPLPWLGYTFIAGRDLSYLGIPSIAASVFCLAAAAHQYAASRRGNPG